jgi:pilus assembly protein Flp/PilA
MKSEFSGAMSGGAVFGGMDVAPFLTARRHLTDRPRPVQCRARSRQIIQGLMTIPQLSWGILLANLPCAVLVLLFRLLNARRGLEIKVRRLTHLFRSLSRDESGGELIEYAIVLGLIAVAAITIIGTTGTKVLARWTSVNSSM